MTPSIGTTAKGPPLPIDVERLLLTRMLLQADSGGGKTMALKRILEQTHGHVQQIIIDPEGEFSTLREKFDYLLCAPEGADAIANPKTAAILARKLRETRVSAVLDIYDLRPQEQKHFVRIFIEELLAAPKSRWYPCVVVIDEAQVFAPENDKAESHGAIMDLRGRGRKRGLCPILATPRLAELSKDACAGLQNKLIGVTTLDLDVKRAARDLALTPLEATTMLRNLDPGEFFCFGPALTRTITKVKIGPIKTSHGQHTVGKDTRPPAPSAKIKAILAKLADLPKEAEKEAHTVADLKRETAQLRRELAAAKRVRSAQPTKVMTIEKPVVGKRAVTGITKAVTALRSVQRSLVTQHKGWEEKLVAVGDQLERLSTTLEQVTAPVGPVARPPVAPATIPVTADSKASAHDGPAPDSLPGPQQRILDAIAWFESIGIEDPNQTAVAFLAGYKVGGGAFNNPRGALRSAGLLEYRGKSMALTEAGRAQARTPTSPLTNDELHRHVMDRLPGPERKILQAAIEVYPEPLTDTELAEKTNYAVGGGALNNPKGRLRTLGLLTYPASRQVRAADLLFPQGSAS